MNSKARQCNSGTHVLLPPLAQRLMLCLHYPLPVQLGFTALMAASQTGHTETVAKLIQAGAKLDVQNMVREGGGACGSCCSSMCVCLCCACVTVCVCVCVHVCTCTRMNCFYVTHVFSVSGIGVRSSTAQLLTCARKPVRPYI